MSFGHLLISAWANLRSAGQAFDVRLAINLLLILPAKHAFCEMFMDLCVNLGSHFGDMEYVMFWRTCKSFIYLMTLHL